MSMKAIAYDGPFKVIVKEIERPKLVHAFVEFDEPKTIL